MTPVAESKQKWAAAVLDISQSKVKNVLEWKGPLKLLLTCGKEGELSKPLSAETKSIFVVVN